MGKKIGTKRQRKESVVLPEDPEDVPPTTRSSDEPVAKKVKWVNKQRVLVFSTRGISHRHRHLMEDIKTLMPHTRRESKMERKENLFVVNEICEMKNCNKCIMFEGRRQGDLYMWMSNIPNGPSVKFLVENIHTMAELKLTGNCLKGSRPILSFDPTFETEPHYELLKELITQMFGTPYHHPKSQPFIDHVMTFTITDNRIWFRNYQILSEDGALAEIGPRFVMNPVKIFGGSFGGETIWENTKYVTPAKHRQMIAKDNSGRYLNRIGQKLHHDENRPEVTYQLNELDEIFSEELPMESVEVAGDLNPGKQPKKKKKKINNQHKRKQQRAIAI